MSDDLAALALRQHLLFVAGDPAFLDCVGAVFLDEGRVVLRGRAEIERGFAGLLAQNHRQHQAGSAPAVRTAERLDLEEIRAAADPQGERWAQQLASMLPDLAEGDVLLWLEAGWRFFNVFRRDADGWKVIGFGH